MTYSADTKFKKETKTKEKERKNKNNMELSPRVAAIFTDFQTYVLRDRFCVISKTLRSSRNLRLKSSIYFVQYKFSNRLHISLTGSWKQCELTRELIRQFLYYFTNLAFNTQHTTGKLYKEILSLNTFYYFKIRFTLYFKISIWFVSLLKQND